MKKILLVAFAALVVASLGTLAQNVNYPITDTNHDLSVGSAAAPGVISTNVQEICGFCHVPHSSDVAALPLWNRTTPAGPYTAYADPMGTIDHVLPTAAASFGAGSLACLSCHDGTISVGTVRAPNTLFTSAGAKGAYAGAGAMTLANSGINYIGTDLGNDHPVGFTYDHTLDTNGGTAVTGLVDAVDVDGSGLAPARLVNGRVECGSCHALHRPAVAGPYLLRGSMVNSALCLGCHIK